MFVIHYDARYIFERFIFPGWLDQAYPVLHGKKQIGYRCWPYLMITFRSYGTTTRITIFLQT